MLNRSIRDRDRRISIRRWSSSEHCGVLLYTLPLVLKKRELEYYSFFFAKVRGKGGEMGVDDGEGRNRRYWMLNMDACQDPAIPPVKLGSSKPHRGSTPVPVFPTPSKSMYGVLLLNLHYHAWTLAET